MRPQRTKGTERGVTSMQVLVILVPVIFAFMGFAIDLARLYLIRMEMQTAANAAALAAAARLIGTDAATVRATEQFRLSFDNSSGYGNKYDFGARVLGESSGYLSSETPEPSYYDSLAAAVGGGGGSGGAVKYARVNIRADAPLLFFGFLPIAQERKTPIDVSAVAGVSAPLCTACGFEPIAIQALDTGDTTDFGFTRGNRYTLGYLCTGTPTPGGLGDAPRIPYLMLNRYNDQATLFPDEGSQSYRVGAQGMLPTAVPDQTTDPTTFNRRACMTVNTDELVWVNATPQACNANTVPGLVTGFLCGLATRFEAGVPAQCTGVVDVDTMSTLYQPDTDISDITDYPSYAGSGRRVITVAVVETLAASSTMQPLGFRQFLLEPNSGSTSINASDSNGRFTALYIGYPMPLRQGRFDGCTLAGGPGKVVLHQ